jgi:hypothetical protein
MRYSWRHEEWGILQQVYDEIDRALDAHFGDAFVCVAEIQELVRTPLLNEETGDQLTNSRGHLLWVCDSAGFPIEDYSKLTLKQLSDFFMRITTHLLAWEQSEAQFRGEALFAKAQFEEQFAVAYDAPMGKYTVEHRQAKANVDAADERYHAVFRTMLSHKSQAIVKSMERLSLRLKELYVARTT